MSCLKGIRGKEWDYPSSTWGGTCQCGKMQSPVDLDVNLQSLMDRSNAPFHHIQPSVITNHFDNTHTLGLDIEKNDNNYIIYKGITYHLVQVHYHAGSENTINGEQLPLEVHFVHKSANDDLAVFAVFLTPTKDSPLTHDTVHTSANALAKAIANDDLNDLEFLNIIMSEPFKYANYEGSLTTPPCTEDVQWFVMMGSSMSECAFSIEQTVYDKIISHYSDNFRPPQNADLHAGIRDMTQYPVTYCDGGEMNISLSQDDLRAKKKNKQKELIDSMFDR